MQANVAQYVVRGEDASIVCEQRDGERLVVAVVDGHGGDEVVRICKTALPSFVETHTANIVPTPSEFVQIFASLHEACEGRHSGAVVTACVVERASGRLGCANVGDVLCAIVSATSHAIMHTTHRLQDNAAERQRLSCFLGDHGPPRLYPGGLSCSRCIGDYDCPRASCEPAVAYATLGRSDTLVLASDGLWESRSMKSLARVVRATRCAASLVQTQRQYPDDATAVIVAFRPPAPRASFAGWLFRTGSSSSSSDDEAWQTAHQSTVVTVPL